MYKPSYLPSQSIFPDQPVTLQAYLPKVSYNPRALGNSKSCSYKGEYQEDQQEVCQIQATYISLIKLLTKHYK